MRQFTSQQEYEEFLDLVVKRARERDPSPPEHVANVVVQQWHRVGNEYTRYTQAEPYLDYRVSPCSILIYSHNYTDEMVARQGIRNAAVYALRIDLEQRT